MFLTKFLELAIRARMAEAGRNPLKSGQCFLHGPADEGYVSLAGSQSPQIGSMFLTIKGVYGAKVLNIKDCRNPLKSGQCFLPIALNVKLD